MSRQREAAKSAGTHMTKMGRNSQTFVPCRQAARMRKSKASDAGELKAYIRPRG